MIEIIFLILPTPTQLLFPLKKEKKKKEKNTAAILYLYY